MELSRLNSLYGHDGPFVTVYLEGRSSGEDAGEQIRLWRRALRQCLLNAGAIPPRDLPRLSALNSYSRHVNGLGAADASSPWQQPLPDCSG